MILGIFFIVDAKENGPKMSQGLQQLIKVQSKLNHEYSSISFDPTNFSHTFKNQK